MNEDEKLAAFERVLGAQILPWQRELLRAALLVENRKLFIRPSRSAGKSEARRLLVEYRKMFSVEQLDSSK